MKRSLVALAALVLATPAFAVTLHNKDSKKYDIRIESANGATSSSIDSGTVRNDICKKCKIKVSGVGEVDAEGNETVVIEKGKISKK